MRMHTQTHTQARAEQRDAAGPSSDGVLPVRRRPRQTSPQEQPDTEEQQPASAEQQQQQDGEEGVQGMMKE